ncbi:MAG: septation protein SepH [Candidatus Nanopelagicales bacterium]
MHDLEFVAFSDDGDIIILQTSSGDWIEVPIKKPDAPVSPITPSYEFLSPREIQSRIRHGASPEQLAGQTGASIERIMLFAPPILQERAHVANKAGRTIIRRASGAGPLREVVIARLLPHGVQEMDIEWDAHRREDGRWNITVRYPSKDGIRVAHWLFDVRNSALVPADEEARWLTGEALTKGVSVATNEQNYVPTTPHLSVVPLVEVEPESEPTVKSDTVEPEDNVIPEVVTPVVEPAAKPSVIEKPAASLFDQLTEEEEVEEKRPRLPSWDEILFGAPKKLED